PAGGAELLLQSRARSATGLLRHCDCRTLCRRTAQQWAGATGVLFRAGQCGDLRCLLSLPVGQAHDRLEAVGAMNFSTVKEFSELPPVGEAVCLDDMWRDGGAGPLTYFSGYRALWLNSGTAALALALIHAREAAGDEGRREVI